MVSSIVDSHCLFWEPHAEAPMSCSFASGLFGPGPHLGESSWDPCSRGCLDLQGRGIPAAGATWIYRVVSSIMVLLSSGGVRGRGHRPRSWDPPCPLPWGTQQGLCLYVLFSLLELGSNYRNSWAEARLWAIEGPRGHRTPLSTPPLLGDGPVSSMQQSLKRC